MEEFKIQQQCSPRGDQWSTLAVCDTYGKANEFMHTLAEAHKDVHAYRILKTVKEEKVIRIFKNEEENIMTIAKFAWLAGCSGDKIRVADMEGNVKYEGEVNALPKDAEWSDKTMVEWTIDITGEGKSKEAVITVIYED